MGSLQHSLAEQLRQNPKLLVYEELPLGPNMEGTQRADVLTMTKSYGDRIRLRIYEVKESRGDFTGDVGRGKYQGYFKSCHQLYFAAPTGLIKKDELPAGTGLIVRTEGKGWHVVKAPPVRDMNVTKDLLLACLFRGQAEEQQNRRLSDRIILDENLALADRAKQIGWAVARRLNGTGPEVEAVKVAKGLIDEFLGQESGNLQSAVWKLRTFLDTELPGLRNVGEARDLLGVVYDLIRYPEGTLNVKVSFQRLAAFVDAHSSCFAATHEGGKEEPPTGHA